jgi:hypothetical protein
MELLEQLNDCLQKGDSERVSLLTQKAVDEGIEVRAVLDE